MTRLDRHPAVKRVRRRLTLLRRTGRWRPDHLPLAASGNVIHVDVDDARGWEIIRGLGRGHQPALIALWRSAVDELQPTVVVDVGANYGELTLSGSYPAGTRVLAIEANPAVAAHLRRSVAAHPDAERITVHQVLASDVDGGRSVLRVDPVRSGSASVALDGVPVREVDVAVRRIDRLADDRPGDDGACRLLLKVDAEGWEAHVLAGATDLLDPATDVVALVEFDPAHLRRAGTDPSALHQVLCAIGPCWSVAHDGRLAALTAEPVEAVDVLVVRSPDLAVRLGAPPHPDA